MLVYSTISLVSKYIKYKMSYSNEEKTDMFIIYIKKNRVLIMLSVISQGNN